MSVDKIYVDFGDTYKVWFTVTDATDCIQELRSVYHKSNRQAHLFHVMNMANAIKCACQSQHPNRYQWDYVSDLADELYTNVCCTLQQ